MKNDTIKLEDKNLDQLIKAFSGKIPMARVGVFSRKGARVEGGLSNAQIGAAHEFGRGVPRRSFLRMPLTGYLGAWLRKAGVFSPGLLEKVIRSGNIYAWVSTIGATAQDVVLEAFATGGFGKWKPSNMSLKKNHQTLVETQQLMKSIEWDVK